MQRANQKRRTTSTSNRHERSVAGVASALGLAVSLGGCGAEPLAGDDGDNFTGSAPGVPDFIAKAGGQCGPTDDRVPSDDPAIGYLDNGCSTWILPNENLATAGQCKTGFGGFSFAHFLDDSGTWRAYRVDADDVDYSDAGPGDDWAVFRVAPNPETGLTPRQAQGRDIALSRATDLSTLRITGHESVPGPGAGETVSDAIQQTGTGEFVKLSGTSLFYEVDTSAGTGNSGSPVIDVTTGKAVGVHTHGGCLDGNANQGTHASLERFWTAANGTNGKQSPYEFVRIPGKIQAENYDVGGLPFFDTTPGNAGHSHRNDDVDIQRTTDDGGGYNVGWIEEGEWLEYTVGEVKAGTYDINLRVATATAGSNSVRVWLGNVNQGVVSFDGTGGWQNWTTASLTNAAIGAPIVEEPQTQQVLRLEVESGRFNLNWVEFSLQTRNLARDQPTQQSSLAFNGTSDRAVDGNTNGNWRQGSVTHTREEFQPWWQVDLGLPRVIDFVNLWNRTDSCCVDRLRNFYVLVSDEPFTSDDLNATIAQPGVSHYQFGGAAGAPTKLTVDHRGRYVRVQLAQTGVLNLAEVEVHGRGF